ncbi:MAG: type I DNA topoisomerase, partial [Bacteroidia bacterium]|nr:type I DNA topoisomerase [Bacteroidia bacterium]
MIKNLLIVESPAKAKTIEKYLGKDFTVKASMGHIRDLPKGDHAIDIPNGFKPVYEISHDKYQIVNELRKLANEAEQVWLASDEDREGEAISWHLAEVLNLSPEKTFRIVFHEITKPAILQAVQNPRKIDMNLVNAQQARRVLDRLVGFELSPILWKKVKAGLSAGRVQSVAVRLIVDREREIQKFQPKAYFRILADFQPEGQKNFKAEIQEKIEDFNFAEKILQACIKAEFQVSSLETKPGKRSPAAPFTTSTLQQEASRKLGFSVATTMSLAQRLYEAGHITYMRTDSVNLSDTALEAAKQVILANYGASYHQLRRYKTKSANAQEAHEAIRPTDFSAQIVSSDNREQKLYELIWKRFVASQMAEALLEVTSVNIRAKEYLFRASGTVVLFDGFLSLY